MASHFSNKSAESQLTSEQNPTEKYIETLKTHQLAIDLLFRCYLNGYGVLIQFVGFFFRINLFISLICNPIRGH